MDQLATGRRRGPRSISISLSARRFSDYSPEGNFIQVRRISSVPAASRLAQTPVGSAPCASRSLGPRPLTTGGSVWTSFTTTLNGRLGYIFDNGIKLNLDVFNILNTPGEPDRLLLHLAPAGRAGGRSPTVTSIRSSRRLSG